MRVCFILHSSIKGGAEGANLELIDGLKEQGINCFAILPSYGPMIDELMKINIPLKIVHYWQWVWKDTPIWKRYARTILNILNIIMIAIQLITWKIDIVYTNTITICVGAFAAKLIRCPHIWHIHEFGYEDHRLHYIFGERISLKLMDRLSSACIVCSNAVAKKYKRIIPERKLRVVYYAVDIPNQHLSSPSKLKNGAVKAKCLIVGTVQEGKRQEDAIRAVGELKSRGINIRLYIVGDEKPRYKRHLQTLVTENDLENDVEFLGYVDNPFPLMQETDIVLMCSRAEAFGRVTIEAMKAGRPVIGTRSGGTEELVRDGSLLYAPGDHEGLAREILYLYENPLIARQIGENNQKWAMERFTRERYAKDVLGILEMVHQPQQR